MLEEDYLTNVKKYILAVKAAIRDEPPTQAEETFHSAITFLTQKIPNPTSQAITPLQSNPTTSKSTLVKSPPTIPPITPVLSIANPSPSSSSETSPIGSPIPRPLEEVRQGTTEMAVLPGGQTQAAAAAAVTSFPTASSASALSSPLKNIRRRKTFTAITNAGQNKACIQDVQLLPGGRLLLADGVNDCVKLFDTQGQHLHTLECRNGPRRLAVLDSCSIRHTVVVTVPLCQGIDLLEVAEDNMTIKRTLQTSRGYVAVAAINDQTLAVGYSEQRNRGIDLIDLGGQVLRQICSSVGPLYMDITEDGYLMCSTYLNTIARVQVDTGAVVFDKSVQQIKDPCGVAITSDGSILVMGDETLDLVSSQGVWIRQLWFVPSDRDQDDYTDYDEDDGSYYDSDDDLFGDKHDDSDDYENDDLFGDMHDDSDDYVCDYMPSVSTDGSVCICVISKGFVHTLDCL